jgi:hypothetical protein
MAGLVNGGPMKDLKLSNADAGDKRFFGVKEEESTYTLPGYVTTNTVASDGTIISTKNPKTGGFKTVIYNNMAELAPAFEFLQAISNSLNPVSMTIKNTNGIIYSGTGAIEGEVSLDTMKSTISFEMVSSDLTRQ